MWFSLLKVSLFMVLGITAVAQTQVNPGRDIRWPGNCNINNPIYSIPGNVCIQPSTGTSGPAKTTEIYANSLGVMGDAKLIVCNISAGVSTISCFNDGSHPINFDPVLDKGKKYLCYGCGAATDAVIGSFLYVSGGTAPPGYPSSTQWQRVDFTDGGPNGGPCATPPAGIIQITNGVPSSGVSLWWGGDGCVTVPTHGQIAGFSGLSTFSGGSLGHAMMPLIITNVIDSVTVAVSPTPLTSVGGSYHIYGTDDTASFKSIIAANTFGAAGNARLTFSGASIVSDTLAFYNWSGSFEGTGNMPLAGFNTGANPVGSILVWGDTTPGKPIIDNQGGSNMSYAHFGYVGNAGAPPIALQFSGYTPTGAQLGAQNYVDDIVFGLYGSEDPNVTNGVGSWGFKTGIMSNTVPGNVDFMRACVGVGCTFYDVKYPSDGNNDQAVDWEWGTLRVFGAHDAFCVVGAPHVAVMETAFTYNAAVHQGSCLYGSQGTSYAANGIFDNISSDGDPELFDSTSGEGTIVIKGGGFGYGYVHNDGILVNGNAPGGNIRMDISVNVGPGVGAYSGFPAVSVVSLPNPFNLNRFNGFSPYMFNYSGFTIQSGQRGWEAAPLEIIDEVNYFGYTGTPRIHKYLKGLSSNFFYHHQEWESIGLSGFYGLAHAEKLRSPDYLGVSQVSGATPGTTVWTYAIQCVIDGRRTALNFDMQINGATYSGTLTTGAAVLTPTNANKISWASMNACDNYYILRKTAPHVFRYLTKNGVFATLSYWDLHWLGGFIDDGSYTLGPTASFSLDESGSLQADSNVLVGGSRHPLSPSDLAMNTNLWPGSAGVPIATGRPGTDIVPHYLRDDGSLPPPFVATASSSVSCYAAGCDPFHAFDGRLQNEEGIWTGAGGGADWLELDVGSATVLSAYSVQIGTEVSLPQAPSNFTLQGSNDNSTWTTLDTQTSQTYWQPGEIRNYILSSIPIAYRYFRLNITANNGDPVYTSVGEMYLYAAGWKTSVAGLTTTVTVSCGTLTFTNGILTSKGTCP